MTIAQLVVRDLNVLRALGTNAELSERSNARAVYCHDRLKLWSGSLGAHRTKGERCLEYRLRDSSNLRQQIESLLQQLLVAANEVTSCAQLSEQAEEGSALEQLRAQAEEILGPTDTDLDSQQGSIFDHIDHLVHCLLRLAVVMRNPQPLDRALGRHQNLFSREYARQIASNLREYPRISDVLAERLGESMARRKQYFKYREEHASRLQAELNEGAIDDTATTVASSLPSRVKDGSFGAKIMDPDDAASEVTATSLATSAGVGKQLRVPRLPHRFLKDSFDCFYCHTLIRITDQMQWRRHVLRDLHPYSCTIEQCQQPRHIYSKRRDWVHHLYQKHWGAELEYEEHDTGETGIQEPSLVGQQPASVEHMKPAAGDINAKNPGWERSLCIFCDVELLSKKHFVSHTGSHLKSLAISALPPTELDEVEEASTDPGDSEEDRERSGSASSDAENVYVTVLVPDYRLDPSLLQRYLNERFPAMSPVGFEAKNGSYYVTLPRVLSDDERDRIENLRGYQFG